MGNIEKYRQRIGQGAALCPDLRQKELTGA